MKYVGLAALFTALAVIMTWPLGRVTVIQVPASDDAYFSIWRLAWIAHQLTRDPWHLFDANIFHPATGTLAYSDAMLMVGAMGAPLFALGLDPGIIHNLLMLIAIVASMLCAFALAHRLTGSDPASLLAAIIFGFAPYRMAHIGHLELQWTMWMPLSMLVLHRLVERPSMWRGMALGAALGAQALCSIYYGVFLSCYLTAAWLALVPFEMAKRRIAIATTAAILPLAVVAAIYAPPYLRARADLKERRVEEVQNYSATPADYLRVPVENMLRGARHGAAPDERSLFPGAIALLLGGFAIITSRSRVTMTYLALAVVSVDLSFGVNGLLFRLLRSIDIVESLRAPSRFGVLALLSIAMLAAIGAAQLFKRFPRVVPAVTLALVLLCLTEYWSGPFPMRAYDSRPTDVEEWLAIQVPGTPILNLPTPTGPTLWRREADHQLRSINHWLPLVNGYSALAPESYIKLIDTLKEFPGRDGLLMLRDRRVRFILIHRRYYDTQEEYDRIVAAAEESTRLWPVRTFGDGENEVRVFELNYLPE